MDGWWWMDGLPWGDGFRFGIAGRLVLLYDRAGSDAAATDTIPDTGPLYTAAVDESLLDIVLVYGAGPAVVADDADFAAFDVNLNGTIGAFQVTTQTIGAGGTGDLAPGQTVRFSEVAPFTPDPLAPGDALSFSQGKGGAGVKLGPYKLYLVLSP